MSVLYSCQSTKLFSLVNSFLESAYCYDLEFRDIILMTTTMV